MIEGRVFLVILDSLGIGGASDAALYGDEGSHTLASVAKSPKLVVPNLRGLGLFNIDGLGFGGGEALQPVNAPRGAYGRLQEVSAGKDTTIGHWEIAGLVTEKPLPVFPRGFPPALVAAFEKRIGRKTLCHMPYSGTQVICDYGAEHMATGFPIVYTSADSVFQIAAHEEVVPLEDLYGFCEAAREMLAGEWGVGRVIARPFAGDGPDSFRRTARRRDYSLPPPAPTLLDCLAKGCRDVIGVGKISDIFAGRGLTRVVKTGGNDDGMEKTLEIAGQDFEGLCFVNLVDFDMLYGHRNDVDGYADALSAFDAWLGGFLGGLREGDLLLITADHGCDPGTPSTDHSRENVPFLAAGPGVTPANLGTRQCFGCVANTIADFFEMCCDFAGESLLPLFYKGR